MLYNGIYIDVVNTNEKTFEYIIIHPFLMSKQSIQSVHNIYSWCNWNYSNYMKLWLDILN